MAILMDGSWIFKKLSGNWACLTPYATNHVSGSISPDNKRTPHHLCHV